MTLSPSALLQVAAVVFAGYLVFGITGFGASPITVPVLAHFLPLPFVLALAALLDLGSALVVGYHARRQADVPELARLLPFTLVGLALGVTLLVRLPQDTTLLALGLFVCVFALSVVFRGSAARRVGPGWAVPAGIAGGLIGGLFGTGGPPYVMYIAGRITEPAARRATISLMVVLNVGLRVGVFALAGLLASHALWVAVPLLMPVAWVGVWVGHRVHVRLSPAATARVIGAVLFVTGVSVIVRALSSA